MSTGGRRRPPDAGDGVVQKLLAERRELMVEVERLRLQNADLREDPRVARLEAEVGRLKQLLEQARAERDALRRGVEEALDQLRGD